MSIHQNCMVIDIFLCIKMVVTESQPEIQSELETLPSELILIDALTRNYMHIL
jgi:hypothetical protein